MNDSLEFFAAAIKAARKKQRMSQRTLGKKTQIPQSHLSKIEQGKVDLQVSSLIQIARALDLELMLISRPHVIMVQALEKGLFTSEQKSAFILEENAGDDA